MSHHEDLGVLAELDDAELERRLLASAADDAPPPGASERAFCALAADARALAALGALAPPGERPVPRSDERRDLPRGYERSDERGDEPARGWLERAPYRAALAALVLGVVAGGAVVALWSRAASERALLVPPLPPRRVAELALPELSPESAPPPVAGVAAHAEPARAPSQRAERTAAQRASRLAREVAALDAARASLAIGAAQSTLRQIEHYRAEFPDGELAADAEVVAIEALAAEGDHAALALAARRFLDRYPRDPHAPRVRELAFIKGPQ